MYLGSKRFLTIALFTALLIVLVNVAWWFYYRRTADLLEQQLSRRLISLTQSTASAIPSELIEGLMLGDLDSYSRVISRLETIRIADSLAELFILDENYNYLATTAQDADPTYFLARLNGPYIDSLLFGLTYQVVATETYQTGDLYLKSAFAPLLGTSGQVIAILGVEASVDYFEDLTEVKRNMALTALIAVAGGLFLGGLFLLLQQNLIRAEQQLFVSQTHSYLGRMVAVVSHEIKNPLMIIRASAERLARRNNADEARFIVEETDRLNGIVTGYLDFARPDRQVLANEAAEEFDLCEVILTVKKHLEDRYSDQPVIWLDMETVSSLPMLGYRRSLRQVILNLLMNSAEACLSQSRPITVGIGIKPDGSRVKITVADQGLGMSKRDLKKLFTPFFTTKQTGSGLGLYVSRRLVSEMGGTLTLDSQFGEGTQVVIDLPKEVKR